MNYLQKHLFILQRFLGLVTGLFAIAVLLPACTNREGPVQPRDNLWDSGGDRWHYDGAPSISGTSDTSWYDFDHDGGCGSVRLSLHPEDPNLSHDTLSCNVFIVIDGAVPREMVPEPDLTCILTRLRPATTYQCSLTVADIFDSTTIAMLQVATPGGIPPPPPEPVLTSGNGAITLSWPPVKDARFYVLYRTEASTGPFQTGTTIPQPSPDNGSDPIVYTDHLDERTSCWYVAASANRFGECRSRSVLFGRTYSDSIAVPVIDEVSGGTLDDCIRITWHCNDKSLSRFEIYRSSTKNGTFELCGACTAPEGSGSLTDTVQQYTDYCYKVAAVDGEGRSGRPSDPSCGYRRPALLPSPVLTAKGTSDHLRCSWTAVKDAEGYIIYRSSTACGTDMIPVATATATIYRDSVVATDNYYYAVTVIDSNGHEAALSNCATAALGLLGAPEVHIVNTSGAHLLTLSWNALPAAKKYTVFRSINGCPDAGNAIAETVDTFFIDTVSTAAYHYYTVAPTGSDGRKGAMSACVREKAVRLPPPGHCSATFDSFPDCIALAWDTIAKAGYYLVFRSAVSCDAEMVKIDSTAIAGYTDTVPTSAGYYYRIAGVDDIGIEGQQGACAAGRVKLLDAPGMVQASCGLYADRIRINWQAVPGANGYVVMRGTTNMFKNARPVDTVTSLFKFDSVKTADLFFYWVCARNELGNSTFSSFTFGRILTPTRLQVVGDTGGIRLTWNADTSVVRNTLYRYRADSSVFVRIGTVAGSSYFDTVSDYASHDYLLVSATSSGDSCIIYGSGVKIPASPSGLSARSDSTGTLFKWNALSPTGTTDTCYLFRSLQPGDSLFLTPVTDTSY